MFMRLWTLTRIGMALSLGTLSFVGAPTPALAQQIPPPPPPPASPAADASYQGESAERYAQVRSVEGEVVVRKGDLDERLERGIPVAEGDIIDSRGRGVLQLGDGTRIAFSSATRFQVAALFTDRNGERQVLLRLDQGRIRIALGSQSQARLRVDTQAGTAAMLDRGNATVQVEGDQSVRVKVHSGHLTFSNDQDRVRINGGERLTIYSRADRLNRVSAFNTYDSDAFDGYCERALEMRRGASWDRVPAEIRYYSDELDENGEWVDVPEVGWCWRPRSVAADWRPYWQGRWGAYPGGMTWVSDDPWGYVTFHFGRWGWGAGWGWYWIPGSYYSPAWVAWNWNSGYYGWAPLNYWNHPCSWGYGAWGGGYCWNVVSTAHINARHIHAHVHSDRTVLAGFHGGTGSSSWNGAGWGTAPLMVSQAEFRNPAQMARAFDRQVATERMRAYERAAQSGTGRVVVRREPQASPSGPDPARSGRIPFEDHSRSRVPGPPVTKSNTGVVPPQRRPADSAGPGTPRADSGRDRGGVVPPAREDRNRDFFGDARNPEPPRREGPVDRRAPRPVDPPPARERVREVPPPQKESKPAPREDRRSEPDRPRESYREERPSSSSRPSSPPPSSAPSRPSSPPPSSPPPSGGSGPRR